MLKTTSRCRHRTSTKLSAEINFYEENMNDVKIRIPPYINTKPLVIGNQVYQSFYDFTLTEKDLKRARTELGETDERKEACLRELKQKLLSDENVKYRLDDSHLLRFLRTRKYDVDKTYENVKHFYHLRNKYNDWFALPEEIKPLQELNITTCLPYTDEEGCVISLMNAGNWKPYEISYEEHAPTGANVADIAFSNPKMQINGVVGIYDLDGVGLKHVTHMLRNGRMWGYAQFATNCFPVRIRKIICINTNKYFQYLYSFIKTFIRNKIKDRIILLGSDMNDLHQHVNPALLPKRLNGTLEEEQCNMTQFVLDNLPYIRYERSFIT